MCLYKCIPDDDDDDDDDDNCCLVIVIISVKNYFNMQVN